MTQVAVVVTFFSRRQNTNQGQDQYRIWLKRSDADAIARHIRDLQSALQKNTTWSQKVEVRWKNGCSPKLMSFGAYANQSGEMSFTAPNKTKLCSFAETRHHNHQEDHPIDGSCTIDGGVIQFVELAIVL